MTDAGQMIVGLRVHLTHAALQAIADEVGADVLHVKGPAVDDSLRPQEVTTDPETGEQTSHAIPRLSTDADIIVRPAHVNRLMAALIAHRWRVVTRFHTGSAFEHAASLWHTTLGYCDVHRRFPGIQAAPAAAFDVLWAQRVTKQIAHRTVWVPSVDHQRLLLLLHAARGGSQGDVRLLWRDSDEATRARMITLAEGLHASVALAAATGRLEEFRDDPSYDLWRHFSTGETSDRLAEWRALLKAARTPRERLHVLARSLAVNTDHLAMQLNRPLTRAEIAREYARRGEALVTAVAGAARRRLRRARR